RDASGFAVGVTQSFGNCPQYIQARGAAPTVAGATAGEFETIVTLTDEVQDLIAGADTLFIASAFGGADEAREQGVDVSHRGGRPGFVRIDDDRNLTFPDFAGNLHFNTVGNLVLNPRAGLLFIDFDAGHLVTLTGSVEIIWDGDEIDSFAGAERLVRFRLEQGRILRHAVPYRWEFDNASPALEHTGSWAAVEAAAARRRAGLRSAEVVGIWKESDNVKSFYLKPACCGPLDTYRPGQFLPLQAAIPGQERPAVRTYSLSSVANGETYRVSVKREADGQVSRYLHDELRLGDSIDILPPRGDFVLDQAGDSPVVLISAGVGVTPMIAMLEQLAADRADRDIVFIHGARNRAEHAFADDVRRLAARCPRIRTHVAYSAPGPDDDAGVDFDSQGRIDRALLSELLPSPASDVYLCGPAPFMQAQFSALRDLGVPEGRINYEYFGPGGSLAADPVAEPEALPPVTVRFARSGIETRWHSERGSLLELAEAEGLAPEFGCRSGNCGTCVAGISQGAVRYAETPAGLADREVLICTAQPVAAEGEAVVLEL
ncbi:MAG: 2Fe-2S iron-sulfur cluster binding domain-containing protein, partial [Gammaproteobacteria bacterium]|nr:2Fe-2S iron-sulfur cluster binding domain-containing protein [Gammaproteobacteria bacterium]